MFLKDDIYTSSGSLKLYHCWTDKVTKFDSSSFYNWEQDNMPVYDLDERTFYLWEKLGYPTSSIPGVSLVVSADASDTDVQCNKNIFRTVSAAIEALPQTINFPVIIEVANFGQLGDLVLDNYKFGPRGSIEIINRNFAKCEAEASTVSYIAGLTIPTERTALTTVSSDLVTDNNYFYGSSLYTNDTILFYFTTNKMFTTRGHFLDSSCLSISAPVFSSTTDARLINNLNGFVSTDKEKTNNENSKFTRSNLIIDSKNNRSPYNPLGIYHINFKTYDLNSDTFDGITSYDASTTDEFTNTHLYRNDSTTNPVFTIAKGIFFGNKFNKISITNCDGPIYLRNFFLDGSGYNKTDNYYGVKVDNSNNVHLENIVVTRYRKAGLLFNNSKVKLLRGCVATRIYDFDVSGKRLTNLWTNRRNTITLNSASGYIYDDPAGGIVANNSYIEVSSTRKIEEALMRSRVLSEYSIGGLGGPNYFTEYYPYINNDYIFDFSKNANGIILNNSVLVGGDTQHVNQSKHFRYSINFDIYANVGYGIKSSNSKISLDGKLNVFENLRGLRLDSSVFEIDKLYTAYNQKIGLESYNSNILYNKHLASYQSAGTNLETHKPLTFEYNGQHLKLNNSKLLPAFTSGMDLIYDATVFNESIGVLNNNTNILLPAVEVTNNSEVVLVSPYIVRGVTHANSNSQACKGSELSVTNNSKARLIGAKYFATRIFGPAGRTYHSGLAGVYAGKNSTVELNGPTVIAQYGVDLLGESHSNININPHKLNYDAAIDVSSFTLSDKLNHTSVELHATRSCIVVDDHSELNVKDLGSYSNNWNRTGQITDITLSGVDYTSPNDLYVSAGGLQFYPNPIGSYPSIQGVDTLTGLLGASKFTADSNNIGLYYLKNQGGTTDPFTYSSVTTGGFCVRALNDSVVNVHNVNFPCGWWQVSAPYYDITAGSNAGGYCYKTFIWNIADNSQLKASYLSVSGGHPRSSGYFGPSGLWGVSGPASGLPNSTPDTSSLSVLDYFGKANSLNPYGKTTASNYGPFRLYFTVNPLAYSLVDISSTSNYGIIPQIYSQGYQPSASLLCSSLVSSMYSIALQRNSSNNIVASGYYYGSGLTDTNGYTRVLLDESAAETFANAKHCSVGKSGNSKLVSIHYPYTTVGLGSSYNGKGITSVNTFDLQRDN